MMDKLLVCLMLIAAVGADTNATDNNQEVGAYAPWYQKVQCTPRFEWYRDIVIDESKCEGKPKREMILLPQVQKYELMHPRVAWVSRCRGPCTFAESCVPTSFIRKYIPVRIYNSKTNTEACAKVPIDEHENCTCPEDYTRRTFNMTKPKYKIIGVGKVLHEVIHELPPESEI